MKFKKEVSYTETNYVFSPILQQLTKEQRNDD